MGRVKQRTRAECHGSLPSGRCSSPDEYGEQVIVSSPGIMEPVAVRYGWANHPVISVFNKKGLPLAPFRTDDWE